jgi:hypothetical protein
VFEIGIISENSKYFKYFLEQKQINYYNNAMGNGSIMPTGI